MHWMPLMHNVLNRAPHACPIQSILVHSSRQVMWAAVLWASIKARSLHCQCRVRLGLATSIDSQ